ncbi:MAG: hypothetical protein D6703_04975, partial [Zetaproteobacteria bacterium]
MRSVFAIMVLMFLAAGHAFAAEPVSQTDRMAYESWIAKAAQGDLRSSVKGLNQLAARLPSDSIWHERCQMASLLLEMRRQRSTHLPPIAMPTISYRLVERKWRQLEQLAPPPPSWLVLAGAVVVPGGGHAIMGRWHDAWVSFVMTGFMVWLTCWAFRRRMGPVTVFFGVMTVWLWGGTIFSAVSLHERFFA